MDMESRIYQLDEAEWKRLRPDLTKGISGKSLLPGEAKLLSATLTRVEPGGEFPPHQDSYSHVLYFFEGQGEGSVGDEKYVIKPGTVAQIPAGMIHGYRNTGAGEMFLLTFNISAD